MNGAIRVLDIEIYDPSVETWAQGRYLVPLLMRVPSYKQLILKVNNRHPSASPVKLVVRRED